jgi:outer membrane protein
MCIKAYVDVKSARITEAAKNNRSQEFASFCNATRFDGFNSFDFSQSMLRYDNSKINIAQINYCLTKKKYLELYFGIEPRLKNYRPWIESYL